MTERLRSGGSFVNSANISAKMANDLTPRKTLLILVIVVGCFAVLWPKVFYPMLVGSANQHIKPSPIDKTTDIRQERPMQLRSELVHPAFRERGRAIPQPQASSPRTSTRVVEGRPGPIPGMRPTLGGAGHVVPPPKQGTGSMGLIMPIYTIGIVIFFTYTVLKIIFKKQPEALYPPVEPDPNFRREVFESERSQAPKLTREGVSSKLGWKERDARDAELDQLRQRLRETELAMERIVEQMAKVPLKLQNVVANGNVPQEEDQPSVKVLGMEMTASCEGGKKWSRPNSPVLPVSTQVPQEPPEPPQEIFLEGALPAQSHLLVADSATQAEKTSSEDPAVVLAGKMTLSVISLDSSENGTDESSNFDKKQETSSSNVSDDFEKIEAEEQVEEYPQDSLQRLQEIQLLEQIQNEIKEIDEKDIIAGIETASKSFQLQDVEHPPEPIDINSAVSDIITEFIEKEKDRQNDITIPEVETAEQHSEGIIEEKFLLEKDVESVNEPLQPQNIDEGRSESTDIQPAANDITEFIEKEKDQQNDRTELDVEIAEQQSEGNIIEEKILLEKDIIADVENVNESLQSQNIDERLSESTDIQSAASDITEFIKKEEDQQNNSIPPEVKIAEQHSEEKIEEKCLLEKDIIANIESTNEPLQLQEVEELPESTDIESVTTEFIVKEKDQQNDSTEPEVKIAEGNIIQDKILLEKDISEVETGNELLPKSIDIQSVPSNVIMEFFGIEKDQQIKSTKPESIINKVEIAKQPSKENIIEERYDPENIRIAENINKDNVERKIEEQTEKPSKVEENNTLTSTQSNNVDTEQDLQPSKVNITEQIPELDNTETATSELPEASELLISSGISESLLSSQIFEQPSPSQGSEPIIKSDISESLLTSKVSEVSEPKVPEAEISLDLEEQLEKVDDERGISDKPQPDSKIESEPVPTSGAITERKVELSEQVEPTSIDEKEVFEKLNAAISDLSCEFRPSEKEERIERLEEPLANDEEIEYEYGDSDNEVVDEEIRNINRLDDGLEDATANGRLNGENQEHSKYGTTSSATLAENDISDEEVLDEDDEVQEIIEYFTEDEEEIEDIIELACTNNTNHLPEQPGAQ